MFHHEDTLIGEGGSTVTRPMRPLGKINGLVVAQEEEILSAPGPVP
jgi:hypothetical protein